MLDGVSLSQKDSIGQSLAVAFLSIHDNGLHSGNIGASNFDGWLIKGGEARSIEAATVAGDIRQVLNAIVGFEGDAKVTPDGLCPMVWLEGLSITGER